MPLLDAKCPNCGGILKVDGGKEAAICEYCGNAYVVEKAIQNYYVTNNVINNYTGDINVLDNRTEELYNSARRLEDEKMFADAEEIYKKLTEDFPDDYRGWWGMFRTSHDGRFYDDNPKDWGGDNYIIKAIALAPDSIKEQIIKEKNEVEERRDNYLKKQDEQFNPSLESLIEFVGENGVFSLSEGYKPCWPGDYETHDVFYRPIIFCKNGKLFYYTKSVVYGRQDSEKLYEITGIDSGSLEMDYIGGPDWYDGYNMGKKEDYNPHTINSLYKRGDRTKCIELQIFRDNRYNFKDNICELSCTGTDEKQISRLLEVPTPPPAPNFTIFDRIRACYIATCVYGSYDCPQVWTLRRFRDLFLLSNWYGRMFTRIYYAISPHLVKLFGNKKWFRDSWRKFLDKLVEHLKDNGYMDTPYRD